MIDLETTQAFLTVIEYLSEKFGVAVDVTNKNLVPYLQELGDKIVAYEKSISIMWIIVGIIMVVFGLTVFFIGCFRDWECMHWLCLILGVGIGAAIIISNMYTYIGCNTFEEKIILDYIEKVMSTSSSTVR